MDAPFATGLMVLPSMCPRHQRTKQPCTKAEERKNHQIFFKKEQSGMLHKLFSYENETKEKK